MINDTGEIRLDRERLLLAKGTVASLLVLFKTARLYDKNNRLFISQSEKFHEFFLNYIADRNSMTIKFVDNRLLVDEQHISLESDERQNYEEVLARWNEFEFGGLVLGDTCSREHVDYLATLLWSEEPAKENPRIKLQNRMAENGINSISLLPPETLDGSEQISIEERKLMRQEARLTFFKAIATVKEVLSDAPEKKEISVSRTRRVVHSIIDQISQDEAALMEMAAIRNFDEYTFAHCTNVCIYSLTLGFRLGLSKKELLELGLAAIFHDIGKIRLPSDLINKPERFDEYDWAQMHRHPILGAMTVARSMRLDHAMARAMAVAFEHHINPDHSGYPTLPEARMTNLYSKIVSIADSFDALSSGRIYIKDPIPPDEVMRKLMYQMKSKFDPLLLKIFIGVIGIYPIGVMVHLSNDTFGIVTRTNSHDLNRPEVRIFADKSGELAEPRYLNLSHAENMDIAIRHVIDPEKYGLDPARYILTD